MESNFKLRSSNELGDFLVSRVDMEEAKVILTEAPLFTSPKEYKSPGDTDCCLTCLKIMKRSCSVKVENRCAECQWPVCSEYCAKDKVHQAECAVLSKNRVDYTKVRLTYLKVIRIILAKGSAEYESLMGLCSTLEKCKIAFQKVVMNEAAEALDFAREMCKLDVTFGDVFKILSILRINRFMIDTDDLTGNRYEGYGVFKVTCKFSHSCAPNLEWAIDKKVDHSLEGNSCWEMRLHTRTMIKQGQVLSLPYTYLGLCFSTSQRWEIFRSVLVFDCLCSRCKSITEERTYIGSTVCQSCDKGNMLPTDALKSDACMWKCTWCSNARPSKDIAAEVSALESEIQGLTEKTATKTTSKLIDQFIERNSGITVHENHFLLLKAYICWLFQGEFTDDLLMHDDTSKELFKKIKYRAERVRCMAKRFLPTMTLVDLELFLAQRTAEFVFKSSDHRTIEYEPRKLRYCKKVLSHLTNSLKWEELHPRTKDLIQCGRNLRTLHAYWTLNVKYLSGQCESYEREMSELSSGHKNKTKSSGMRLLMCFSCVFITSVLLFLMMISFLFVNIYITLI